MLNTRIFIVLFILVVVTVHGYPLLGPLTEDECKAYFSSEDINKQLHAIFVCPQKCRPKTKFFQSSVSKRSIPVVSNEEELDDVYLFW